MNFRCRGPAGQFTLSGIAPGTCFAGLQQSIAKASGILTERQDILHGFPPKPLQHPQNVETSIAEMGLASGETLILREKPVVAAPAQTAQEPAESRTSPREMDEDEQLARALAASMQDDLPGVSSHSKPESVSNLAPPPRTGVHRAETSSSITSARPQTNGHSAKAPQQNKRKLTSPQDAFTPVSLGDGSVMTRRIIESDNSCLFNAVGYVMERSRQQSNHLRQVIADTVAQDQDTYTSEFLGKANREYQQWIKDPRKWGGAIELSILSRYYGQEIAALDIQTKRVDVYGQAEGYRERAFILYDGLHYDAMAQAAFSGAPEELDVTLFETSNASFAAVERGASALVAQAHEAKQYTDTGNFTLMCGICKAGVKGEKEALQHAKETGHQSFQEYH